MTIFRRYECIITNNRVMIVCVHANFILYVAEQLEGGIFFTEEGFGIRLKRICFLVACFPNY